MRNLTPSSLFKHLRASLGGLLGAFVLASLLGAAAPVDARTTPALFQSERAAQSHCPTDVVVWLNLPSGVYHYKGERWYANTRSGAFVCEQEAIQAGDRATKNGQ